MYLWGISSGRLSDSASERPKGNLHLIFILFVVWLYVIYISPKVNIQSAFCSDFYSLLNSSDKQNVSTYVELLEPLFSTRRYPVTTRASNEPELPISVLQMLRNLSSSYTYLSVPEWTTWPTSPSSRPTWSSCCSASWRTWSSLCPATEIRWQPGCFEENEIGFGGS